MSHFLHCPAEAHSATGRTPRAAWYNQQRDNDSDPLTLGKPKKVYFLFAILRGVVHTLHKSELDDITNHKPPHRTMKTDKTTIKQALEHRRAAHHAALLTLAGPKNKKTGLQIWRALRKVETIARAAATAYCNGDAFTINGTHYDFRNDGCDAFDAIKRDHIKPAVARAFGGVIPEGFFVNGDPRGLALKLHAEHVPAGMATDWGRDGILAAEID